MMIQFLATQCIIHLLKFATAKAADDSSGVGPPGAYVGDVYDVPGPRSQPDPVLAFVTSEPVN